MQHLPYIDSLWLGEGYWYDRGPDYWLAEASGLPFGLMGESMNGPPELGLVYGMAPRIGHLESGPIARRIWAVWDAFGIERARMHGYWEPDCPVEVGGAPGLVLRATAYVRQSVALIAVGDFTPATSLAPMQARTFEVRARAGFWGWHGAARVSLRGDGQTAMLAQPSAADTLRVRSFGRHGVLLLVGRTEAEVQRVLRKIEGRSERLQA